MTYIAAAVGAVCLGSGALFVAWIALTRHLCNDDVTIEFLLPEDDFKKLPIPSASLYRRGALSGSIGGLKSALRQRGHLKNEYMHESVEELEGFYILDARTPRDSFADLSFSSATPSSKFLVCDSLSLSSRNESPHVINDRDSSITIDNSSERKRILSLTRHSNNRPFDHKTPTG